MECIAASLSGILENYVIYAIREAVGMPNGQKAERIFGRNADSYCPI